MKESLGLADFFERYPERAFDVGICEENAAVLCASFAAGGLKPYYAIYSTFLQRAFDEIIHDVCSMDLPVTFCIDRAGISGSDGETHQGVFDLSYLSMIPNMTVAVPKDTDEYAKMLEFSATFAHPLAIRYPRAGKVLFPSKTAVDAEIHLGKWEYLTDDTPSPVTVLATGERSLIIAMKVLQSLEKSGKTFNVVNARFVKPLDETLLRGMHSKHIVTIEDNMLYGGFGAMVNTYVTQNALPFTVKNFAYTDKFIEHGGVAQLQKEYGVSCEEIERYIAGLLP